MREGDITMDRVTGRTYRVIEVLPAFVRARSMAGGPIKRLKPDDLQGYWPKGSRLRDMAHLRPME